ncbi:MAG: alcohol dehydrogenase catalytic domain-containing protein [Nitriliruptorales bacterium]|nr:alcohol dehydrogenase catalytic domain-containing protein [Nitriliruptorales bacterium]
MKAVVLSGPGEARLADIDEPSDDGRAVVRVHEVGICGTDLKILSGSVPVRYPRVLGHEIVGEVIQPGHRSLFATGTRVLIDPSVACGHCERCRDDQAHLCRLGGLLGRDLDGGFAESVAVDELQLHALPDDVPWRHGPLLQILGTCVHGQSRIQTGPGDTAVVVGLGVSGLLQVQLLRARGVRTVIGVTRSGEKLQLAKQLGATAVAQPDEAAEVVSDLTQGEGVGLVVEASGVLAGMRTAVGLARPGATLLLFGTLSESAGEFPYYLLYLKELALISSRGARPRDYAGAIDLVRDGAIQLDPLLSERFLLDDANQAFARFRDGSGVLKVTMRVGAEA